MKKKNNSRFLINEQKLQREEKNEKEENLTKGSQQPTTTTTTKFVNAIVAKKFYYYHCYYYHFGFDKWFGRSLLHFSITFSHNFSVFLSLSMCVCVCLSLLVLVILSLFLSFSFYLSIHLYSIHKHINQENFPSYDSQSATYKIQEEQTLTSNAYQIINSIPIAMYVYIGFIYARRTHDKIISRRIERRASKYEKETMKLNMPENERDWNRGKIVYPMLIIYTYTYINTNI